MPARYRWATARRYEALSGRISWRIFKILFFILFFFSPTSSFEALINDRRELVSRRCILSSISSFVWQEISAACFLFFYYLIYKILTRASSSCGAYLGFSEKWRVYVDCANVTSFRIIIAIKFSICYNYHHPGMIATWARTAKKSLGSQVIDGGIIPGTFNCASWAVRHFFKLIPVRYPDSPRSLEGRIHSLIPSVLLGKPSQPPLSYSSTRCEVLFLHLTKSSYSIKGDNGERVWPTGWITRPPSPRHAGTNPTGEKLSRPDAKYWGCREFPTSRRPT